MHRAVVTALGSAEFLGIHERIPVARRPARGDWAKALRCRRLMGHRGLMYGES